MRFRRLVPVFSAAVAFIAFVPVDSARAMQIGGGPQPKCYCVTSVTFEQDLQCPCPIQVEWIAASHGTCTYDDFTDPTSPPVCRLPHVRPCRGTVRLKELGACGGNIVTKSIAGPCESMSEVSVPCTGGPGHHLYLTCNDCPVGPAPRVR